MQSRNASSDPETRESEHRAEDRGEVLPNFIVSGPKSRAELDGQPGPCASDESVSVARDGDEYLIVGNNESEREEDAVSIERVPAVRHAVVPGERLWKIPDNWTQYIRVHGDGVPDRILYKIPDPSVTVVIRTPRQDDSDDTRYEVEHVGRPVLELVEEPDRDALHDLISTVEEQDDASEAVVAALQSIEDDWHDLKRAYHSYMDRHGGEMVWGMFKSEGQEIIESWSVNPWDTEQDITRFIPDSRDIDTEVLRQVAGRLVDVGVVSPSPDFEIALENEKGLPTGYFVQALTEKGCSPTEIVDWVMVKTRGHTPSTWSDVRGEYEQQIAEHIRAADNTLTS